MQGTDRHYEVPKTTNKSYEPPVREQPGPAERIAEHTGNTDHLVTWWQAELVFEVCDADGSCFSTETFGSTKVQLYARDKHGDERVLAWITPEQAERFALDLVMVARQAREGRVQAS